MATLPAGIIPDAKGRKGAAYYSDVSRIMLNSAATQSQIIASQTAIGMQAVGGVIDSLNQGFSKYLDYSLAVKEADFAREMRLREVQLREEEMDMKRAEAYEMTLTRALDRKNKEMDNAQREQDVQNAPWKRMALAQLSGVASKIKSAVLEARTGTGDSAQAAAKASEHYREVPLIIEQFLLRGGDPSAASKVETELAQEIDKLNSLQTIDGRTLSRSVVQGSFQNPFSAAAERNLIETFHNQDFQRDSVVNTQSEFIQGVINDPSILGVDQEKQNKYIVAAAGGSDAMVGKLTTIFGHLESEYLNNRNRFDGYRRRILKETASEGLRRDINAAETQLGQGASNTAVMRAVEGGLHSHPAPSLSGLISDLPASAQVINYPGSLEPDLLGRAIAEGMSLSFISRRYLAKPSDTRLFLGHRTTGKQTLATLGLGYVGSLVGAAAQGVARYSHDISADTVIKAEDESAIDIVKTAANMVADGDSGGAVNLLTQWGKVATASRTYSKDIAGIDPGRSLVPISVRPTLQKLYDHYKDSPEFTSRFETWIKTYAADVVFRQPTPGGNAPAPAALLIK